MALRRCWRAALIAGVAVALSHVGEGAVRHPAREQQERPTFSSKAELVVLHVTVKDRRGAYVTGLSREAFTVLEDRRPQSISVFTAEDSPVTVGLIIDSSGSMRAGREHVIAAATAFARASHSQDDLFAITFNERVRSALSPDAPFTGDPAVLQDALVDSIQASGRTALYDAIARGLEYVEQGRHPRRVLVVVADGGDNASVTTFDDVLRRAQASNAAIYTVGVIDPLERDASRGRLRELARATGGDSFFPRNVSDVGDVLRQIAEEIRHTYTIGYVPAEASGNGAYRRLRVVVRAPGHRSVTVRTREGYRPAVHAIRDK